MIVPEEDGTYTAVCEAHAFFRFRSPDEALAELALRRHRRLWRCELLPDTAELLARIDARQRARGVTIPGRG